MATIRDNAPGQSELDAAIARLEALIHDVDAASLAASSSRGHVADCLGAGADGVAVTDAVTRAPDPQSAAAALRAALDAAWRVTQGG